MNNEIITKTLKPLAFIGSSREGLNVLEAIHQNLEQLCEIKKWTNSFPPGPTTIDSLVVALTEKQTDFAIFVIAGDDTVTSRGQEQPAPRDNVIFELGLAIGILSKERVFMVQDRSSKLKIPTDLLGITAVTYDPPGRAELADALGPACTSIKQRIETLGLLSDEKNKTQLDDLERYKDLVREYENIQAEKMEEKVRKKNEIGGGMGEFIIRQGIPKADISVLYSENNLVGLLFAIIIAPQSGDHVILLNVYNRIKQSFSRHKLVEALTTLAEKKFIPTSDKSKLAAMLKSFIPDHSPSLPRQIGRAMTSLGDMDCIRAYTVLKGKLKINTDLRITHGAPRCDYLDDEYYEKVFSIEGTRKDAVDCTIDVNGQVIKELEYTFINHDDLIIYAQIKVKDASLATSEFWLALKTDITEPRKISNFEWSVPVQAEEDLGHWRRAIVNLPEAFQKTTNALNHIYVNLEKVRFRGAGKIGGIFVR